MGVQNGKKSMIKDLPVWWISRFQQTTVQVEDGEGDRFSASNRKTMIAGIILRLARNQTDEWRYRKASRKI